MLFSRRCKALNVSFLSDWMLFLLFSLLLLGGPLTAFADWSPLIERLIADGIDEPSVRTLFSRPEVTFEPGAMSTKLESLLKKKCAKTTGVPSWKSKGVHKGFLKEKVLGQARSYIRENSTLLENIRANYCVPKEVVVSILLVETRLGQHLGGKYAFNTLASMALCADLEIIRPYLGKKINPQNEDFARTICRQKGDWAYNELKALIAYAEMGEIDPLSIPGSIYGAIGICQFMPSNIFPYGIDADRDGRIDLFSKADALHSIANYLREHGWRCAMDNLSKRRVIYEYNHSSVYANTILAVADKLSDKGRSRQRRG
jgi:membrane-bound lytic murein transglycosylase B